MRLYQLDPKRSSSALLRTAAACFLALAASCHSHDDSTTGTGAFVPPAGASGAFLFGSAPGTVLEGEFFDFAATLPNGAAANIVSWRIVNGSGGALADRGVSDSVRFVAGSPAFYAIEAADANGNLGYYGFNVVADVSNLVVVDVINGTDADEVEAHLHTSGASDLFLAEKIGGSAAPQTLTRVNRAGDREVTRTLGYKVLDLASDDSSNVTMVRTESTLTNALVRVDRDLNDVATFMAPDLGGALWSDVVAMTRTGETLIPTDLEGGSLLRLDANGAPVNGTPEMSLYPLGIAFGDVVDVATDIDGAAYVASLTQIRRIGTDGVLDTVYWSPEDQVEIRDIATDEDGVLFVSLQDADGGQCGSLRKLDWTGREFRRIIEFVDALEFADRKLLSPVALGVYPDGAWRLYDDIVTLNPAFQRAAWVLASEPVNN